MNLVKMFHLFLNISYRLVVVGGGSGGCSVAAKFCAYLPQGNVAVIEPNDVSI